MNLARATAVSIDSAMCAMMYAVQRRHRLNGNSRAALESYVAQYEPVTRDIYFRAPVLDHSARDTQHSALIWPSPFATPHPENNRVHVDLFPCATGWSSPTVLFLHALMSTSDRGYRRWAAEFNARGWNACFVHLPYHYSRVPRGHWNGELAITADLVRTAEGLRQGVTELRQLMTTLRTYGCREFGLWASSYGGWIGARLSLHCAHGANRRCRARHLDLTRRCGVARGTAPRRHRAASHRTSFPPRLPAARFTTLRCRSRPVLRR